jgi:hypothetical protein
VKISVRGFTESGDFDDGGLGGEALRFRIADDHPYQIGTGIKEEREGCGGLDFGIIVGPMHGDFSIDGAQIFAVAIKNGGDNSQLVGVFSVGLAMGKASRSTSVKTFNFVAGLSPRMVCV